MKWVLVALVMNTPVKTDLVFESLPACLAAESQMRTEWAEVVNEAKKLGIDPVRAGQISQARTTGTCIPSQ